MMKLHACIHRTTTHLVRSSDTQGARYSGLQTRSTLRDLEDFSHFIKKMKTIETISFKVAYHGAVRWFSNDFRNYINYILAYIITVMTGIRYAFEDQICPLQSPTERSQFLFVFPFSTEENTI